MYPDGYLCLNGSGQGLGLLPGEEDPPPSPRKKKQVVPCACVHADKSLQGRRLHAVIHYVSVVRTTHTHRNPNPESRNPKFRNLKPRFQPPKPGTRNRRRLCQRQQRRRRGRTRRRGRRRENPADTCRLSPLRSRSVTVSVTVVSVCVCMKSTHTHTHPIVSMNTEY